jgi:chromosome segregation ATPase
MAARLEERTAEAVEYRTRLELTELTQSTVEAERERLREDLARERERADRAERRLEELETSQELRDGHETASEHRTGAILRRLSGALTAAVLVA